MPQFLGEYECAIDSKGRMRIPSPLLRQLGEREQYSFVVNRGMEKCIMLYPKEVWDQIVDEVNQLNWYEQQNRIFIRQFYRGATEVESDNQDRILINKRLLEHAGIEKEAILFAYTNRMEIWSVTEFENMMNNINSDFSALAGSVMGKVDKQTGSNP